MSKTKKPTQVVPKNDDELLTLVNRAQNGDKSALPAIREILKEPKFVDALGGDLAKQTQLTLVNTISGQNLLLQESLTRKIELMNAELMGPDPSPLERLLVSRVVTCWLHLYHLEITYAQKDNMTLTLGTYYQHCLSAAQKRYLAAIKTLAQVRRLVLPVLLAQVNVMNRQQVSVGG